MTHIRKSASLQLRLAALVVATVAGVLCTLVAASAVPLGDSDQSLIVAERRGSITVVKSAGDPLTRYGDPANPIADTTPRVDGVEFAVQKIAGIDLSTSDGWQAAEKLAITDLQAGGSAHSLLGPMQRATTNASGMAVFSHLELGLYYVTQVGHPHAANGYLPTSPVVVAVPTTGVDGKEWVYDVTVRPKDQRLSFHKTASVQCVTEGEPFSYTLTGDVPPLVNGSVPRLDMHVPVPAGITVVGDHRVAIADGHGVSVDLDESGYDVATSDGLISLYVRDEGVQAAARYRVDNPSATLTWTFNVKADPSYTGADRDAGAYLLVAGYPDFDPVTQPGIRANEVTLPLCHDTTARHTPPGAGGKDGRLPFTGAQLLGAGLIGLVLIVLGGTLKGVKKVQR